MVTADVALAVVGGRLCTDLRDVTADLSALDSTGFWAVVIPFEGPPVCARFAEVRPATRWPGDPWVGWTPPRGRPAWTATGSAPGWTRSGR